MRASPDDEAPVVVTLFAPAMLQVTAATRLAACRPAWAGRGWRPYDRSDRRGWDEGDVTIHEPEEEP
jgi:hypothetical protein